MRKGEGREDQRSGVEGGKRRTAAKKMKERGDDGTRVSERKQARANRGTFRSLGGQSEKVLQPEREQGEKRKQRSSRFGGGGEVGERNWKVRTEGVER